MTAPPPDVRSSRAAYTQWQWPDGSNAVGGGDSSEKSGRPESNEYLPRWAKESAAPPRPECASRRTTKRPWVTANSAAAHKLPVHEQVTTPSAVVGRDGRRVAPPTASEQVLWGEGGGGAADMRGVDRPGRAAGRVGYAAVTGNDVNSGCGPPRQPVGRPACCVLPRQILAGAGKAARPLWRVR